MTREERYKNYIAISGGDMSPVTNYVAEIKQQKAELMEINTCLYSMCDRLEKQNKELMEIAECHMTLLLNGEDVSFGNEHDQAEGERIWLLLNKYKEGI